VTTENGVGMDRELIVNDEVTSEEDEAILSEEEEETFT
jgi:hypothetical protein